MNKIRQRKQMRLRGYDYADEGAYFVTVCTFENMCILGEIINGKMIENEYGQIVRDEWMRTAHVRSNIILDAFVVMPNHIHGIIIIGAINGRPTGSPVRVRDDDRNVHTIQSGSLGAIIGQFKSIVTKRINANQKMIMYGRPGGSPLCGNIIWHRSFHDRIIRNEQELNAIREYIQRNPEQWQLDAPNIVGEGSRAFPNIEGEICQHLKIIKN